MDSQNQNHNEQSLELLSQELRSILLNPSSKEEKISVQCPSDAILFEHQRGLLDDTISSGDEDFRCVAGTPPVSERAQNAMAADSPNSKEEKISVQCPSDAILFEHQRGLLEDTISSGDEDFRCVAGTPPASECAQNAMAADSLNSNEEKNSVECPSDAILLEHQQEMEDKISSGDEDFRCVAGTPSASELCPCTQNKDGNTSNELVAELVAYDREKLLLIRNSKSDDDWLSYLWLSHGRDWLIKEMPFQLDRDLRCSFGKQQRVLREREENMKQNNAVTERRQHRRKVFGLTNNMDCNNDATSSSKKKDEKSTVPLDENSSVQVIVDDDLSPFTDNQMNVWVKYLSYINLRIKEATGRA